MSVAKRARRSEMAASGRAAIMAGVRRIGAREQDAPQGPATMQAWSESQPRRRSLASHRAAQPAGAASKSRLADATLRAGGAERETGARKRGEAASLQSTFDKQQVSTLHCVARACMP